MHPRHTVRKISGLKWAELSSDPWPKMRLEGAAAKGKSYERKVLAKLATRSALLSNPWFEFCDAAGGGMCSPDGVIPLRDTVLVIECKLTWTFTAHEQLEHLYFPVLEHYFKLPAKGVVVCRNLVPKVPKDLIFPSFREAARAPFAVSVVQWLERGEL